MSKAKILILFTVLIDVLGLGIIIPILPFYVGRFNSSAIIITALFSVFALCSFFSAPLIGSLSDKYGRRPLLIISILSTSIGWFIFAWAPSLIFLFIGRIIDGLAAGNLPVAQSYLIDLAKDDKERTQNLGLIGAMFGIGLIIGPMIGGFLGSINPHTPFWLVAFLSLANVILAYWFLPESKKTNLNNTQISFSPLKPIINAYRDIKRRQIYIAWFLFCSAVATFQSIFAIFINRAFGWGELAAGSIYAGVGIIIIINQGYALKKIWLKYFTLAKLNTVLSATFAVGFLMMLIQPMAIFFVGLFFVTLGQSVLRVSLTSTASADTENHGEILGILTAIMSLSAGLIPLLAGWAFNLKMSLPFLIGASFTFLAYLVLSPKKEMLTE